MKIIIPKDINQLKQIREEYPNAIISPFMTKRYKQAIEETIEIATTAVWKTHNFESLVIVDFTGLTVDVFDSIKLGGKNNGRR